jgi:hypothetical protein
MDEDNQAITEDYGIVEDYSIQKTRPLFYISNSSHFISIHLNYNNEVILDANTGTDTLTYNFGVPSDISNLQINFTLSGESMTITIGGDIQVLNGLGVFADTNYFIGYEEEKYINDFIRQIYF